MKDEEKVPLRDDASPAVTPIEEEKSLPQWRPDRVVSPPTTKDQFATGLCILLNTCATVAMVFLSKRIFSDPQMHDAQVIFTIWHFGCTGIVLWVATRAPFRAFKPVRLPLRDTLPICVLFTSYVILGNLSLTYNSIGFYQLAKVMTTPVVVFICFIMFRTSISIYKALAIGCICAGVSLTNSNSAQSNPFGAIVSGLAVTVTAFYQIWIGKKLEDLDVSAQQLLLNQAPISAFLLIFCVPIMDKVPDFNAIPSDVYWSLLASGITASVLNLSQFLIISRTSALTFNVVGNLKTILILSGGWYLEGRAPTSQEAFGVSLAIGGGWLYSHLKRK
ncbi:Solute carrier family 35 member E3 [Lasiodiplodia theobromae]|uniref:Solute carrier family 35 member E3 n=1 Tax=Lasiodiplodia theobromae TaxID=45133 RepID=UPI0015C3C738|nr:Solute carrier family 35 member E3 [Lasiodiplodia theobromae]KAF4543182.1 Solute carrier family 35 member E3 [Lasiodiplodia theobromae]